MATTVLLLGGECTGKSSLAATLADTLDAVVIPEYLRSFVDQHQRTPTLEDQSEIWQAQSRALDQALREVSQAGVVVCDPAPAMTAIYSVQYFPDEVHFDPAIAVRTPPDAVWVWCYPDIPWTPDGVHRDGPSARAATHQLIGELLVPHLPPEDVVSCQGSVDQRLSTVLGALSR